MNYKDRVKQYEESLLKDLVEFLQIPSVKNESTARPGAPFGEEINNALQFMLTLGEKEGFITKDVEGFAGHIEYGEGEELLGILGHVDVVPEGDGWDFPPYSAHIENGRIYARGSQDDKGPTLAAFYALKLLKDANVKFTKRVRLILGADEESGWQCVDRYFKTEEMPSIGFAPDASFPMINAEKGIADIHFTLQECLMAAGLVSFVAGHRLNMVPDFAQAVVNPAFINQEAFLAFGKSNGYKCTVESEGEHIKLIVEGLSAHGSEPQKGKNAATLLGKFLNGFIVSPMLEFLAEAHDDVYARDLQMAMQDEVSGPLTFNVGVVSYQTSVGWDVGANIRYPVTISYEKVQESARKLSEQYQIALGKMSDHPAHYMPADHPLIQTLSKVYEEETGQEATLLSTGGGTYARALKAGVAFGALFPGETEYYHQKNESADIEKLFEATAIYAHAIYELACK